jgi:hypothetical protein
MATCHDDLIHVFKEYINKKDSDGFKEFLFEVQDSYESLNFEYLFQKVYIHACLKKYKPVVDLLTEKYKELDPIHKIALRQIFAYGNYLLKR